MNVTAPKFTTGQLVQLNSGGPAMTVVDPDSESGVLCHFFDRQNSLQSYIFKMDCLVLAFLPFDPEVLRTESTNPIDRLSGDFEIP